MKTSLYLSPEFFIKIKRLYTKPLRSMDIKFIWNRLYGIFISKSPNLSSYWWNFMAVRNKLLCWIYFICIRICSPNIVINHKDTAPSLARRAGVSVQVWAGVCARDAMMLGSQPRMRPRAATYIAPSAPSQHQLWPTAIASHHLPARAGNKPSRRFKFYNHGASLCKAATTAITLHIRHYYDKWVLTHSN